MHCSLLPGFDEIETDVENPLVSKQMVRTYDVESLRRSNEEQTIKQRPQRDRSGDKNQLLRFDLDDDDY